MSKLPIFDFSQCRESQAKTQVIFQTKTVAKVFYWIGLQSREGCDEEGDEHGETCREKHDKTLDKIRTERDKELDDVRKEAEEAQKQVEAKAKEELAINQAQIEQELKNIREQGGDSIEDHLAWIFDLTRDWISILFLGYVQTANFLDFS